MFGYNTGNGNFINSKRLAEHLGIKHSDLIKRIKRFYKRYIPYYWETNKYAKDGRIKIYKLRGTTLKEIKIKDKEIILAELRQREKESRERIMISLEKFFGI